MQMLLTNPIMLRTSQLLALGLLIIATGFLPLNQASASSQGSPSGQCLNRTVNESFVGPGTKGHGRLCANPSSLKGKLSIQNLTPGTAYTVWWAYIDNPAICSGDASATGGASITNGKSPCEIGDFIGEKPNGVFGRFASGIAPRNGKLVFRDELGGMQPSVGAEVWFWVFAHGPAALDDGAALARQLLTPEDPNAGAPHLGNFLDGQRGFPAATVVFAMD